MEKAIDSCAGVLILGLRKSPSTAFFGVRAHYVHGQVSLQAFQLARDDDPVGRRAEESDVKVISAWLDREVGGAEGVAPGAVGRHLEGCGCVEEKLGAEDGWQ